MKEKRGFDSMRKVAHGASDALCMSVYVSAGPTTFVYYEEDIFGVD